MREHPKSSCPICGKLIANCVMYKHLNSHVSGTFNRSPYKHATLDHDDLFCKYCGVEKHSRNSLIQHEIRCFKNPDKLPNMLEGHRAVPKGATKETCEALRKREDTISKKTKSGWVSPLVRYSQSKTQISYKFLNHNNKELDRWFDFLDSTSWNFPVYETTTLSDGYKILQNHYIKIGTSVKIVYEHVFLMKHIIGEDNFQPNFVVHHIDGNTSNNDLHNLMVFDSVKSHLTYHYSPFAYLTYDSDNHVFSCIKQPSMLV